MKKVKNFFKRATPAIITGAADNDPAGISTYSVAGAQFGYQLNWLMILATPMLVAIEAMSARIANIQKKGLATVISSYYPPPISILAAAILIVANVITIGANLSGMVAAWNLLTGGSSFLWIIPIGIGIWLVVISQSYRTIKKILFYLVPFFATYLIAAFLSKPDWVTVIKETFVPSIQPTPTFFMVSMGLLGTTIAPYLFFWQAKEEVEENRTKNARFFLVRREDRLAAPGFIMSNMVSIFIMIATGSVLFNHGITDIPDAATAARALEPFAGNFASTLFAIGLFSAGLLAIPVLCVTTGSVVAETFKWKDQLLGHPKKEKGFYMVISTSIIVGMIIPLIGLNPIKALFYSQVLNSILAPVLIILLLQMSNNKKIMGKFTNSWFDNTFGGLAVGTMILATAGLVWQLWMN
ncbi:Nramp family divalent metal transporter [Candidatus Microgenomates bacterium]|nr:Nramp family divalent metal transporter [Candidatus Microgenomates bacterium]MBI2622254.1 Nramp family divalent metal transporter [Candidatus Microgenomates bacterium]